MPRISFRCSDADLKKLKKIMKEEKLNSRTDAIAKAIHDYRLREESFTTARKGTTLKEAIEGDAKQPKDKHMLIECPLRSVPVPYDSPFVEWRAPVDVSVCKSCKQYPCESYDHLPPTTEKGE